VQGGRPAGRRQPELAGSPRQGDPSLAQLQFADLRRLGDRRQPCMRTEVAGEQGGHLRGARRQDLLGWRAALRVQAREPCGDLEERIPGARPVPIHEQRATVSQAQVVAAHVHVQQRITLDHRLPGGRVQGRHGGVQPVSVAETQAQERRGVVRDPLPAIAQLQAEVADRPEIGRRWGRVHLVEAGQDGADLRRPPRRRPTGAREIFDRERRSLAVVVEAEHAWQERATSQLCVHEVFIADPGRRLHRGPDLHERPSGIRQRHEPARGRRLASAGGRLPRDGTDTEGGRHASDVCWRRPVHRGEA
jgi:hypothetical protein